MAQKMYTPWLEAAAANATSSPNHSPQYLERMFRLENLKIPQSTLQTRFGIKT